MPTKSINRRRKTWMLSIRTFTELKTKLEEAADETGRSLTQEIEGRLERSLAHDDFVGGPRNAAFLDAIGARIREIELCYGKQWHSDQVAWHAVSQMVNEFLDANDPANPPKIAKPDKRTRPRRRLEIGPGIEKPEWKDVE